MATFTIDLLTGNVHIFNKDFGGSAIIQSLDIKSSVRAGTTSGETDIDLTGGSFSGVIDGVSLNDLDRVLIKNQDSNPENNGLYRYLASSNTFERALDANEDSEVTSGLLVAVTEGDVNDGTLWILTSDDPITLGVTPIFFVSLLRGGTGINVVGNKIIFDGADVAGDFLSYDGNNLNVTGVTSQVQFNSYTATTENTIGRFSAANTPTGIITGGTLSINASDPTQYDIAAGKGVIVDTYTNPDNPTARFIEWDDITGITLSGVTTRVASFVSITYDANDNVVVRESSIKVTAEKRRSEIILGTLTHLQKTVIEEAKSRPILSTDIGNQMYDLFFSSFRLFRTNDRSDIIFSNNGNLQINISEREFFAADYNSSSNRANPNIINFPAESAITLTYTDGQGGNIDIRNTVDPTKYNPNGGNTVVDITGNTNQATIQRVYQFPNGVINVRYGQTVYETIVEANESLLTEQITQSVDVDEASLLIGAIAVTVNAVDLSNRRDSIFYTVSKDGEILGGQNGQFFSQKRLIIVRELGDFPEPIINDEIILRDNYTYKINGFVDIGNNRIVTAENSLLYSDYSAGNGILSNRSDAFIYGRNQNITINNLTLRNLNPSGSVFDFESDGSHNFIVDKLFFANTRVGSIRNYNVVLMEKNAMFDCYDGYIISGNSTNRLSKVKMEGLLMESPISGFTALTIEDSVYSKINIDSSYFILSSGTTALNIPANIELDSGLIVGNEFIGEGTYLTGGLTKGEIDWTFDSNSNLPDSIKLGFLKTSDNTLETVVNNTTDYFLVNLSTTNTFGERFTVTGNRITANTLRAIDASFILTGDLTCNTNNQTINIAIFKNGTTIISSVQVRVTTAGINYSYALNDIVNLVSGDYLDIRVRNLTQSRNIIVSNAQFRVNSTA